MKKIWRKLAGPVGYALISVGASAGKMRPLSGKKAILAVSFGSSYTASREATIGAIENAVAEAFPDYDVRRAFTSQIIIDKLKMRDGEEIDQVKRALDRLAADGIETLVVQPTHVINGCEYDELVKTVRSCERRFSAVGCGKPLLSDDRDYAEVVKILAKETSEFRDGSTAVVFMGHGTAHPANEAYSKLDGCLKASGFENYFVGTVGAHPSLREVMAKVREGRYERVVLLPLLIVAGAHAGNDLAGAQKDSWKTAFESEGYEVTCVLRGMGEYPGIRKMFIEHVRDAIAKL